jgi:hypothetical protein
VDWVLHTHHHRDQCQGDFRAVERGIRIAVSAHERHLFAEAENFWRNRRVFHPYYVRNDFNSLTENILVAEVLRDYTKFNWNGHDISILPTPGHGEPYLVTRAEMLATEEKMQKQEALFKGIVADPDVNFGLDPSWCSVYPYQMLVTPGTRATAEIRVRNNRSAPMKMEVALVAPGEWQVGPEVLKFDVPSGTQARQPFAFQIPRDWRPKLPRFAVAADVLCDGKYLGQITEAVVEISTCPVLSNSLDPEL